jgi:hypothetical protein
LNYFFIRDDGSFYIKDSYSKPLKNFYKKYDNMHKQIENRQKRIYDWLKVVSNLKKDYDDGINLYNERGDIHNNIKNINYILKTIVNSNSRTSDMQQLAQWFTTKGMNALVFNSLGGASVKVYRQGYPVKTYKTKGTKLNELFYYVYKKFNLNDRPLWCIGRRKVDRGLGFHFCPKYNDELKITGPLGDVISINRDGLIWTDIILGKIEDKNTAVQKAEAEPEAVQAVEASAAPISRALARRRTLCKHGRRSEESRVKTRKLNRASY